MKNLTWQNPEQLFVAQELINKVKSKCCGIKVYKKGIVMTKYKLQEMPDVHNTGKRKVYPKMVTNRTLSRKEFIKRMQGYHRGISESRNNHHPNYRLMMVLLSTKFLLFAEGRNNNLATFYQ